VACLEKEEQRNMGGGGGGRRERWRRETKNERPRRRKWRSERWRMRGRQRIRDGGEREKREQIKGYKLKSSVIPLKPISTPRHEHNTHDSPLS
jgi:hypothetical protein